MSFDSLPEKAPGNPGKDNTSYRLPIPSGHTLQERIAEYIRPDGTTGLPVRELTAALHIGTEKLKVARIQPDCLSLASLFGLAKRMGVAPGQLIADVFHQVGQQRQSTHPPAAPEPRKQRARPAAPGPSPDKAASEAMAPQTALPPALIEEAEVVAGSPALGSEPHPDPSATGFAASPVRAVAYADATFPQRSRALVSVQQELSAYFPTLPWLRWAKALDALQPQLWVEGEDALQVTLDQLALQQLLQRLACTEELAPLEMTIHTASSGLMARRLAKYACWAVLALAELEQQPTASGGRVRDIIFRLASGHPTEEDVLAAFGESIATLNSGVEPRPVELLPGSPAVMDRICRLRGAPGGPGSFGCC